jgi:hypothetical protein
LSNNLKDHVYYNIIIRDMEKHVEKEFLKSGRLLSINIDIEFFDSNLNENLLDVRTSIEKKSKDTLFLKTILKEDQNILTQATAIWSKEI